MKCDNCDKELKAGAQAWIINQVDVAADMQGDTCIIETQTELVVCSWECLIQKQREVI